MPLDHPDNVFSILFKTNASPSDFCIVLLKITEFFFKLQVSAGRIATTDGLKTA